MTEKDTILSQLSYTFSALEGGKREYFWLERSMRVLMCCDGKLAKR